MRPAPEQQLPDAGLNPRKAIEVTNVSKTFFPPTAWLRGSGKSGAGVKQALDDLSLEVNEGEMVGLLGPNGAGKTTLSKIITTLMHPSDGEVRLFGVDVRTDPYAARGMMGLVTCDERSFYWRLTGRQNLRFFGALYGLSEQVIAERSAEILDTLDLAHAADRPYHSYSSGMKQKLAIARGLLSNPRILIYDEPTRSLDPLSAHNIRSWIQRQRKKYPRQTHLIATNQLIEAEMLCDRVFIIYGGRLIAQGTVEQIRALADLRDFEEFRLEINHQDFRPSDAVSHHADVSDVGIENTPQGINISLSVRRGSNALTLLLQEVINAGALILHCSTEERAFDDVFCSVIESQKAQEDKP